LQEIFKAPYGSRIPELFDGTNTYSEIAGELPGTLSDLIREDFMEGCMNGTQTKVLAAIEENTLLDWAPRAPIRFYHGDADEVVPYQNAVTAVDNLRVSGGTSVELITIPNGTHETAAEPAIMNMIEWINGLLSSH